MNMQLLKKTLLLLTLGSFLIPLNAQVQKKDTTTVNQTAYSGDRNVMVNAFNNTSPRQINIGLPGDTGGMFVIENGLPVTFDNWPQIPTKVWRQDASLNGFKLKDLGSTAVDYGFVGYTVETTNNLGTDKFHGNATMKANHYGMVNPSINLSGSLGKGWLYSVGGYLNLDPGTYKVPFTRFYGDQTQLYKGVLTKKYKFSGGNGRISAYYKYADSKGSFSSFSPFYYKKGGKVEKFNGIDMATSSFVENSGKFNYLDLLTGELKQEDIMDCTRNVSHTIDLIGNNRFYSGFTLDYTLRFHTADVAFYAAFPTEAMETASLGGAKYLDGTDYTGKYVFPVMASGYKADVRTYSGVVTLGKKVAKHDLKLSLMEQYYSTVTTNPRTTYFQSGEEKPDIVRPNGVPTDQYGSMKNYNGGFEYDKGYENKLSLIFADKWKVTKNLTLNYGIRLEWKKIDGDYAVASEGGRIPSPLGGTMVDPDKLTHFSKNYLNKTFNFDASYNIKPQFGFLIDGGYNQTAPMLRNYAGGTLVDVKQSSIRNAGGGFFYNHKYFSLISKMTMITRDNYVVRLTENHPGGADGKPTGVTATGTFIHDIETVGWTTDVITNPFKGFNLHFLFTYQNPKYKNYKGVMNFNSTNPIVAANPNITFDFSDKMVKEVSKIIIELDPSYTYKKFKYWASARYFGKQYVNISNTVYYKPRIETFLGVDYIHNKATKFGLTITNPLNQSGAKGEIRQTNLYSQAQVDEKINNKPVLAGTTLIPFTVQLSASYRF